MDLGVAFLAHWLTHETLTSTPRIELKRYFKLMQYKLLKKKKKQKIHPAKLWLIKYGINI